MCLKSFRDSRGTQLASVIKTNYTIVCGSSRKVAGASVGFRNTATDFSKNPEYEILRKTILWESRRSVWTDGQAEMMMPVDAVFFANTQKNYRMPHRL